MASRLQAVQAEAATQLAKAEAATQLAKAEAATQLAESKAQQMCEIAHAAKLATLQVRLEELHEAKLLQDDELFAIEDRIADALQLVGEDGGIIATPDEARQSVAQIVALSEGIVSNKMFSRQLRRKFASR